MSWLPACGSQHGSQIPVITNSTEVDRQSMEKCVVLDFSGNNQCILQLACCTISASAELLVPDWSQCNLSPSVLR